MYTTWLRSPKCCLEVHNIFATNIVSNTYKKDLLKWLESQSYWPLMNPAVSSWYSFFNQSVQSDETWKNLKNKNKCCHDCWKSWPKELSRKITKKKFGCWQLHNCIHFCRHAVERLLHACTALTPNWSYILFSLIN